MKGIAQSHLKANLAISQAASDQPNTACEHHMGDHFFIITSTVIRVFGWACVAITCPSPSSWAVQKLCQQAKILLKILPRLNFDQSISRLSRTEMRSAVQQELLTVTDKRSVFRSLHFGTLVTQKRLQAGHETLRSWMPTCHRSSLGSPFITVC